MLAKSRATSQTWYETYTKSLKRSGRERWGLFWINFSNWIQLNVGELLGMSVPRKASIATIHFTHVNAWSAHFRAISNSTGIWTSFRFFFLSPSNVENDLFLVSWMLEWFHEMLELFPWDSGPCWHDCIMQFLQFFHVHFYSENLPLYHILKLFYWIQMQCLGRTMKNAELTALAHETSLRWARGSLRDLVHLHAVRRYWKMDRR